MVPRLAKRIYRSAKLQLPDTHSNVRLSKRQAHRGRDLLPDSGPPLRVSGDRIGGVTPVPIPNTAVKPSGADGTAWVTAWESR
jgi:hypothetical protein